MRRIETRFSIVITGRFSSWDRGWLRLGVRSVTGWLRARGNSVTGAVGVRGEAGEGTCLYTITLGTDTCGHSCVGQLCCFQQVTVAFLTGLSSLGNQPHAVSSINPMRRPWGVRRRSALSIRRCRRNSARLGGTCR